MNRMTTMILLFLTLFALHCKDKGTEPTPERVRLTLIDTAVREAYIHIAVSSPAHNETVALQRNGATVVTFAAVADTNIADTAVTQTTTYVYTATVQTHETTGKSNTIAAQTLAPTSHSFTWQTFLLGDGNNSSLSDVVIISDTLIYAVGEIYISSDSVPYLPYNLAKWNGHTWEVSRIKSNCRLYYPTCGPETLLTAPGKAVFGFSPDDVWIVAGGVHHFDGVRWTEQRALVDIAGTNGIWGRSSNELWFVGFGGMIIHHVGSTWRRLESGTTTRINDAWGVVNPVTGKEEVYCPVSSFFTPGDRRILKISNQTQVDSIRWDTGTLVYSVWSSKGFPLFTAGQQVYENKTGRWHLVNTGMEISTNSIRGNTLNDIFVAGDFGMIGHFNGENWQLFFEDMNRSYYTIAVKEDVVVIVGEVSSRGLVTIGRRTSN